MASDEGLEQYYQSEQDTPHFEYELPEVKGPPIGERTPIEELRGEYESGHPKVLEKFQYLMEHYPYLRSSKGDGNCCWRALIFELFATLIHLAEPERFEIEKARLETFNSMLTSAGGFPYDLFEDWYESTANLLDQCSKNLPCSDKLRSLIDAFNDPAVEPAVIQYYRGVTAAQLRRHREDYENFLDMSIEECIAVVLRHSSDIEHVPMRAFYDAVLKPTGIALHILQLDSSNQPISEAVKFESGVLDPPVIYLLFHRGNHYDILYKAENFTGVSAADSSNNMRTWVSYNQPQNHPQTQSEQFPSHEINTTRQNLSSSVQGTGFDTRDALVDSTTISVLRNPDVKIFDGDVRYSSADFNGSHTRPSAVPKFVNDEGSCDSEGSQKSFESAYVTSLDYYQLQGIGHIRPTDYREYDSLCNPYPLGSSDLRSPPLGTGLTCFSSPEAHYTFGLPPSDTELMTTAQAGVLQASITSPSTTETSLLPLTWSVTDPFRSSKWEHPGMEKKVNPFVSAESQMQAKGGGKGEKNWKCVFGFVHETGWSASKKETRLERKIRASGN